MLKDSGTFEIFIYADEAKTKLIAELEEGVPLRATALEAGDLFDINIQPTDNRVQVVTDL